jgi:acetoacetate decarboxylase
MPGFVKTDEELARIEAVVNPFRYVTDTVSLDFETTWEFARWVLPPCFTPVGSEEENRAAGVVSVSDIYCPHAGPYEAGSVAFQARHGDVEGGYLIHVVHDTDGHLKTGRDIWGGPKKLGRARLFRDGDHVFAYCERNGRRLFEIDAELSGPDLAPRPSGGVSFALKMFASATGRGLEYPPLLCIWDSEGTTTSEREGTGTLRWGHSEHDPVDTIPVVSVGSVHATQSVSTTSLRTRIEIEDPDGVYGRYYYGVFMDDVTIEGIPARWRDVLEVNGSGNPYDLIDPTPAPALQ